MAGDAHERDDDAPKPPSWGNISDHHWTRTRGDRNREAIDYYRERSKAPGVAEGGALRNQYCPECKGVIPLDYDQRVPAGKDAPPCPHCGAALDPKITEHFNWVEIDRVPESDMKALLPVLFGGLLVLIGVAFAAWWLFR